MLPLRAPGMPLDEALAQARAWYAERGLPLRFQLPTEARRLLDAELGERGWPIQTARYVMAAPPRPRAAPRPVPTAEVDLDASPDDAWLAATATVPGSTERPAALLTRHDTWLRLDPRRRPVVAIGRGAVDDGWLGVTAVEVDPDVAAPGWPARSWPRLWQWGARTGATRSYLQVARDNVAAVALYERLRLLGAPRLPLPHRPGRRSTTS